MKRPIILLIIGVVIILIVGGLFFGLRKKSTPNHSLLSTVQKVGSKDQCSKSGINAISAYSAAATSTKKYSVSAREAVLSYLASCNFYNNNINQAVIYATSLENLYSQNHQTTKALNEAVLIKYMKNKVSS